MKNVCSFLTGVIAGGIVALLYAPQSGEKTRKQIKKFLEDEMNQAGEMLQKGASKARKIVDDGVEHLKNAAGQACEYATAETKSDTHDAQQQHNDSQNQH